MKKVALWLFILGILSACAYAEEFAGTRASGMGHAFTAIKGDIDAVYYNPAGLAESDTMELKLNMGSFYQNAKLGFEGGVVLAWPIAALKGMPAAIHADNSQIEGNSIQETGFSVGGHIFSPAFRWGTTLKWRGETQSETQLSAADFGVQSEWAREKISWGLAVKNLMSGDNPLARTTPVFGLGYMSRVGRLTADMSWLSSKMYLSGGWEHSVFNGLMMLRLGYFNAEKSYITAGLSSYLWPAGFDTSFSWPVNDKNSGYYRFAIRYRFGGEHFSEVFLNRAVEKGAAAEEKIRRLESKQTDLNKSLGDSMFVREQENVQQKQAAEKASAPAPVPAQARPAPERVERAEPRTKRAVTWPQYHRVEQDDTLRDIAQRYYDDPGKWQLIYRANTDKVIRGRPQVGADLLIPEP